MEFGKIEITSTLFEEMDENGDGHLTLDEVVNYYHNQYILGGRLGRGRLMDALEKAWFSMDGNTQIFIQLVIFVL